MPAQSAFPQKYYAYMYWTLNRYAM